MSTGASTTSKATSGTAAGTSVPLSSVNCQAAIKQSLKDSNGYRPLTKDAPITMNCSFSTLQPDKKPLLSKHTPWEFYLLQLQLNEEPGTLWNSSLCAIFHDCLVTSPGVGKVKASEYAARIDDVYWKYYLPLDPLFQFKEDQILSSYLQHVWTIFIKLGKKISHDDPAQEKIVKLLKKLTRLPPTEVRIWEASPMIYFHIYHNLSSNKGKILGS